MTEADIENGAKEILSKRMNIDIKKISRVSHLANDLGMDSFGAIEVMFEIEDRFGIEVDEKELTNIKTVGDMVNYIKGKTTA